MNIVTLKLAGAAAGLIFAGAGSAAAFPALVAHQAGTASVLARASASGSAQMAGGAGLPPAGAALGQAVAGADSASDSSVGTIVRLYSVAASPLSGAATQAGTLVADGTATGAPVLLQVASGIDGQVAPLTVSGGSTVQTTTPSIPDVAATARDTVGTAQAATRAVIGQAKATVAQTSSSMNSLVAPEAVPSGSGTADVTATVGSSKSASSTTNGSPSADPAQPAGSGGQVSFDAGMSATVGG